MNIETTWYSIKAKAEKGPVEMSIYDEIGLWGVTAKEFIFDLGRAKGRDVNLTLHTPGGDVADGLAIYNALKRHDGKVTVMVDTIAASMGSVIALAGDETHIVDNGFIMVHNPWTMAVGNAAEMEKAGEDLRKFEKVLVNTYMEATGKDEDEIRALMDAETWMTADEAVENGFAGSIIAASKAAASMKSFKGALAANLDVNRPLPTNGAEPENHNLQTKENQMSEKTEDKSLELQAKIDELSAALESKNAEIEQLNAAIEAKAEDAKVESDEQIAAVRASASEIVKLGRTHNKVELAIEAIAEGKSIEDFKSDLLGSYEASIEKTEPAESKIEVDPSKEPESRKEFLATYSAIKDGRERGAYWQSHAAKYGLGK